MTSRTEVLDLIDRALTGQLGRDKVSRRNDGVVVVAGSAEAFLVQAILVDAPEGADVVNFGQDLVEFIRSRSELAANSSASADETDSDGEIFYTSQNGDQWLLTTDTGGRQFVRHTE